MEIQSTQNEKVKLWTKYHQKKYRDRDHCFLIEGTHLIQEALQAKRLQTLLVRKGCPILFNDANEIFEVSDEVIKKLTQNVSKVDYIGVCTIKKEADLQYKKVILLDDVQDPGNLGTIIRSAYSFGYDAVLMSQGCVDVYNDKVIRSTQGALFHIPIFQTCLIDEIKQLQTQNIKVYGTSLHDAVALSTCDTNEEVALVFGNEGSGVKSEILSLCDQNIKIEMHTFESLNVAVAASICMYYFSNK